jgi:radical SAM superfamily enzyme YgiQ (UPF0313 family)
MQKKQLKVVLFRLCYDHIYQLYKTKEPKKREVRTPEGLLYIAAVALKEGFDVSLIDGHMAKMSFDELLQKVISLKPDILGAGGTTPEFPQTSRLLKIAKEKLGCVTVVGGPHVSSIPHETLLKNPHIDFIVIGEGEEIFRELINAIRAKKSIAGIKGIAYLKKGKPVIHKSREPIKNLDKLPYPAWALIPMKNYLYPHQTEGIKQMASVITSRGCPFNCIFCHSTFGKNIRYRSINSVVEELSEIKKRFGTEFFFFHDETFTLNRERTMKLLQNFIDRNLNIEWSCMTRANSLDEELISKMAESGCVRVSLGIESSNEEILNSVQKQNDLKRIRDAYRLLTKYGIETRGSLILGLPGETHKSIRRTLDFVKSLDIRIAAFNIVTPYPGTELYKLAEEGKGLHLLTKDWSQYKRWGNAVACTDSLSANDLIKWQEKATVEFFTQPKMIWYYLHKWLTIKYPDYYLRPFFYSMKKRIRSILMLDFSMNKL